MTSKGSRPVAAPRAHSLRASFLADSAWRSLFARAASPRASPSFPRAHPKPLRASGERECGRRPWQRSAQLLAPRALTCVALVLLGAVAGLAAGQSMATRSAHRTGACIALNMAAALGYLDAQQQRQVRHALVTAINPDSDLFTGGRPSLREACNAGADG